MSTGSSSAVPPLLSGSIPGLLDSSQPARLLRNQYSQLLFASFNPQTASPDRDILNFKSLSLHDELYRPKRVVIEITPDGSFWRFVPRARREEGATDENVWPKFVDICGQIVNCHQDQWDIYMLDPAYTCLFRAAPQLPTIVRNESYENTPRRTPGPSAKRPMESSSPDPHFATTTPLPKKTRVTACVDTDDEDEVESIISNDAPRPIPTSFGFQRAKSQLRAETEKKRKTRREKIRRMSTKSSVQDMSEDQVMAELTPAETPSTPRSRPMYTSRKRTDSERRQGLATDSDTETGEESVRPHIKRARTYSPSYIKRELVGKRVERGKQRAKEKKLKQEQLRRARQEAFEQELYGSYEAYMNSRSQSQSTAQDIESDSDEVEEPDPEELARQRIEESRRKLAELEKDRPLWEEEAKKRIRRDEAEERVRQSIKEARQRQEDERREIQRREIERREREAHQRVERERIEREEAIRRDRERKRAQNKSRWARGPWTVQRALERYRYLCEQFDNTKYSPSDPITFDDIPWPMIAISFSVEDIAWSAVEQFFESVKPHMRSQEYTVFVEKSHRRFHPDRWRARGLLKSMQNDEERECVEVAANTVAQALTPLWRQAK